MTAMAIRYQEAERIIWNNLQPWQRIAIDEDRKNQVNSSVFQQFSEDVIAMAEGEIGKIKPAKVKNKKSLDRKQKIR